MFRPSKHLLFLPRPMPTLKKFKIHPPLPLNPRESKQLLNLLTTSFRDQLDTAHGFRTGSEVATPGSHQHPVVRERRHSHSGLVIRPTDLHLSSVLENPLFKSGTKSNRTSWSEDPKTVFDIAVSKGLMDLPLAKSCLVREKRRIIQSPVISVRHGMRDSGAGLMVLKWLMASGMASDNSFLKDQTFSNILMEFIVAEGMQEISWKWIKRSFENLPQYMTLPQDLKRHVRRDLVRPLMSLIKAEASGSDSLDAAYWCLSRAASYLKDITRAEKMVILGPPGIFLSHSSSTTLPDRQPPSESAFDSFLGLVPVITQDVEFHFAHLYLVHPSCPSADLALAYLQKMDTLSLEEDAEQKVFRSPKPENLIELGLKTAQFLLNEERFDDADWVMSYLQTTFPKQLGVRESLNRTKAAAADAEAANLQLLEGLNFA